jgi:hypothetical protein
LGRVTVWELGVVNTAKSGVDVPQVVNLNEAMRVAQLKLPFEGRYSLVNQKVQSSTGSTLMAE